MLYLNKSDIFDISGDLVQESVAQAYLMMQSGEFNMPDRVHVQDGENTLLLMPCFSKKYFATKLVSVFPGAYQYNLPAVNGVLVLCDNRSGNPLALMDGAAVTAQRTGAVGGLAVNCLSRETIRTAGIFGAGIQGYFQAKYLMLNRQIETLYIMDLDRKLAENMAGLLEKEFDKLTCVVAENAGQVAGSSELVITATTSRTPLFDIEDAGPKLATFIGIGSFKPDMQEFPDEVIQRADRVFVDTRFAMKESGDMAIPLAKNKVDESKIELFSSLVESPDTWTGGTGFFKSVGMALFDLTVAAMMYETAVKKGMGKQLTP